MRRAIIFSALTVLLLLALAGCDQKEQGQAPIPGAQGRTPINLDYKINSLAEIIKKDPANLNAHIELGNAYMDTKRFSQAIAAYQEALKIDPKLTNARADMGTCQRRLGRPDLAAEAFREVIKIDPGHAYAHKNLGVILAFDMGDLEGGIKEFEKFLELAPADQNAPAIRAEIVRLKTAAAQKQ
ncbi:MAG: tetratricopeptide repeat protein [Thermodesulfovibrionales bacterium]|nr:tetratricopeptide repeat protein [Thermodesulfovibrionales bacterium]